ncbi:hypothetical protein EB73_30790, partial [Mycobacterium sp. SWH-M3]
MAETGPERLANLPPAARGAVGAVLDAPALPVKLLFSGGIGTGKSSVLSVVRTALRDAGQVVLTRPPRPEDAPDAAFVVDDAHLLDDADLDLLTERVSDPAATVVAATAPLVHRQALSALITAAQRENPVVSLGALPAAEVNRIVGAATPEAGRSVLAATAGLPFLVDAAANSP